MKNHLILMASALVSILVTSSLAQSSNGYVGIYSDSLGSSPCASIPPMTGATLYVIAKTAGGSADGITGADFRIEVTNPTGWYLSYNPSGTANIAMGNPIDMDPDPNAGGGLNLGFPTCQVPSDSGLVKLGTLSVFNASGGPTNLLVKRHSQPSNPGYACALFVKCDDPYYSKVCMTAAPPDSCTLETQKARALASDDPTVFTTTLNASGGGSGEPPSDPEREVLALFVPGILLLPPGQTHATLASTIVSSPEVEAVLAAYGVEYISKAFPSFAPEDAVAIGRTGKPVRLQDLSEVYKFLLPVEIDPVLFAGELDELVNEVVFAEPNFPFSYNDCPSDPYLSTHQWSLENPGLPTPSRETCTPGADIHFCDAWMITPGSGSTKIAIMDSGVGPHPDLDSKVSGPSDTSSEGHGTHVAGIAAAETGNNAGMAGMDGAAEIVSKLCPSGSAEITATTIREAVFDNGTRIPIQNHCWSFAPDAPRVDLNTVRGAFRDIYMQNCVAVSSMGNHGESDPEYPAAFGQGILAVGATDCRDQRLGDSGTGDHIDVAAPGVDIWSAVPASVDINQYQYKSGTSFATPHVSGLAGLLLAVNPGLYNDDIEQLIRLSADDVNRDVLPGEDQELGMGRINAHRALLLLHYPHALYHETASGWGAIDSTAQYALKFFVPPDTAHAAGSYRVRRFEVRKEVDFPVIFDSIPDVWGRGAEGATIGFSDESPNWNMGWCEPVPGTITTSGCTLRTNVYEVSRNSPPYQFVGWWPARYDSVQFGYSVLGTAQLTDVGGDRANMAARTPILSGANPIRCGAVLAIIIPNPDRVCVEIFDVVGRRVRVLMNEQLPQGRHELLWDGRSERAL